MAIPPRLVDILPPSLETLLLNFDDHYEVTRQLFHGFADNKKQRLPNLHTMTLVDIEDELFAVLELDLIASGVRVVREPRSYIPKHARYWSKQLERDERDEIGTDSDNDDDNSDDDEDDEDNENDNDAGDEQAVRQTNQQTNRQGTQHGLAGADDDKFWDGLTSDDDS